MRKKVLIILFILSIAGFSYAQDTTTTRRPFIKKRTAIAIVPQTFFRSGLEAAVEQMIGNKVSLKLFGAYYTAEDHFLYPDAESMSGFKLELQPRLYINGAEKGLDGFFFGTSVNYRLTDLMGFRTNNTDPKMNISAEALGVGFVFGQQVISNNGFSFEWLIGGNLISPLNKYESDKVHLSLINPYKRGIVPRAALSIGYAF